MSIRVLHVEDNDLEAMKVERAFSTLGIPHRLERANDGIEALEQLCTATAAGQTGPIVLLDLNLPRMNGFEFLEARALEPALLPLSVYVLTTSARQIDIDRCHRYGIAGYLVKPATVPAMIDTLTTVVNYWSLCQMPGPAAAAPDTDPTAA